MPPIRQSRSTALRTRGVKELIRAADAAGKATSREVRDALRKSAVPVRDAWRLKITGGVSRNEAIRRTAQGIGISVRRTGVISVEQRRRRTTGARPDFGEWQMRRGVDALDENADGIERELERAVDEVLDIFERRP